MVQSTSHTDKHDAKCSYTKLNIQANKILTLTHMIQTTSKHTHYARTLHLHMNQTIMLQKQNSHPPKIQTP